MLSRLYISFCVTEYFLHMVYEGALRDIEFLFRKLGRLNGYIERISLSEFEENINFSEESEPEEGELMDDQEQKNESEPANSSEEKKIPSQIKIQF